MIPGCGNAYEAEYLLQQGFTDITLIDISGVLVQNLQEKLKDYIEKGVCRVIHQDFFEHSGNYDLIVEQTFFCAIHPTLRPKYAKKMGAIITPFLNTEYIGCYLGDFPSKTNWLQDVHRVYRLGCRSLRCEWPITSAFISRSALR